MVIAESYDSVPEAIIFNGREVRERSDSLRRNNGGKTTSEQAIALSEGYVRLHFLITESLRVCACVCVCVCGCERERDSHANLLARQMKKKGPEDV